MSTPTKIVSSEFCLYGDGPGHPESPAHAIYICDRFSAAGAGALVDDMTDTCPDINAANLTTFHEDSTDAGSAFRRLLKNASQFDVIFIYGLDHRGASFHDVTYALEALAEVGTPVHLVPGGGPDQAAVDRFFTQAKPCHVRT